MVLTNKLYLSSLSNEYELVSFTIFSEMT